MRNKKYINSQLYAECQLVAALNACIYLDLPHPEVNTDEYEELVDLCKARHGAAIDIWAAHKKLGLSSDDILGFDLDYIRGELPVELGIWHDRKGLHSVLIVKMVGNRLWLANYADRRLHVVLWSKLKEIILRHSHIKWARRLKRK